MAAKVGKCNCTLQVYVRFSSLHPSTQQLRPKVQPFFIAAPVMTAARYLGYLVPTLQKKNIVNKCSVLPDYITDFSVIHTNAGQCDLLMYSASVSLSQRYYCEDVVDSVGAAAFLTLKGEY
jgi:hypothetical protein